LEDPKNGLSYLETDDLHPDLASCIKKFDHWDSEFIHNAGPPPVSQQEPFLWLISRQPCIRVSREELCGLALILGASLRWDQRSSTFRGEGAVGIDLSVERDQAKGFWRLRLHRIEGRPRHQPSKGSGYTPLFAKHMACGMVPFARATEIGSEKWIKTVFVSEKIYEGIKKGHDILDPNNTTNPDAVEYLRRLPTSEFTAF